INIYASSDCGYTFELIYSINGSNHNLTNTFRNIRIPLTKFGGKNVIFRFNGKWGGNGNFYIDMDNINIKNDTNDFLISSIVTPMSNTCYKTGDIKVVIKNNGTIGKANIPVRAVLSGALNASFNYNYPSYLGVGQEDTIVIGTINSTAGGMTMIQVFTDEKREDMRGNDTSSATFFNTSPVVITPDTNNYCQGGSSVLTASGSNTYKWWDGQTINPININPTSSITVWAEGIDLNNCVDTGYKNIVVYPNPTVGIVNDTICLNQYGTIRATGGVSYNWGAFGVKSAVSHNPTTNTQYDVTVTNAFKCSATGTATIDVKPLPVYTIINDSQCMNNVATVSATGGVSYNWGVYGNSNSVVTNKLIKTMTFPVVITGANGCTVTDMATAFMRPGPNVTITNATICVGSGAQVSAAGGVQYNWGVYGNAATVNLGVLTSSITIPVTVTDGLGCSVVKNATVTVNQKPKLILNDEVICLGASAPLTADISTPGSTYTWSGGLNGSTVNVSPTTTTQYTVTATQPGPGGCSVVGNTTVFVKDKSPVKISPIDNSGVCSNINSIGLSATPVGGTFTGPNVNFSTFSPKKSGVGDYTIYYTFTDANAKGCDGVDSVLIKVKACATGIYSLGDNKEISVYPNPFTTEVNLKFTGLVDQENVQILVYDLTGKVVQEGKAILDSKNNTYTMNLELLTAGAYLIEVSQHENKASFNVVKY
ncbi:MAG: T9SS type A sorting domain-containing protein, partial [Chitinophagales bacterium]|nr:T9SS type A sorting domain-containing protein [Chitinophagales bacterium]